MGMGTVSRTASARLRSGACGGQEGRRGLRRRAAERVQGGIERRAHLPRALDGELSKTQLVTRQELGCYRNRRADDGGDDRVAARSLVIGHQEYRLAVVRHLYGSRHQPEGEQLVAQRDEIGTFEAITPPGGSATH